MEEGYCTSYLFIKFEDPLFFLYINNYKESYLEIYNFNFFEEKNDNLFSIMGIGNLTIFYFLFFFNIKKEIFVGQKKINKIFHLVKY
jgi:hypothetical protein